MNEILTGVDPWEIERRAAGARQAGPLESSTREGPHEGPRGRAPSLDTSTLLPLWHPNNILPKDIRTSCITSVRVRWQKQLPTNFNPKWNWFIARKHNTRHRTIFKNFIPTLLVFFYFQFRVLWSLHTVFYVLFMY